MWSRLLFSQSGITTLAEVGTLTGMPTDGKFTLTYDTAERAIPVGVDQTLTVRYGGSGNLNAGEDTATITLKQKPVTVTAKDQTIIQTYAVTVQTAQPIIRWLRRAIS